MLFVFMFNRINGADSSGKEKKGGHIVGALYGFA
jgi:hypothetical protein